MGTEGNQNEERMGSVEAPYPIVSVALTEFLGSLAILVPPGFFCASEIQLHRLYPHIYQPQPAAYYLVFIVAPFCIGLLGIVSAIGLFHLREWARRVTLYFATVPVLGCAFFLILHHPQGTGDGALFVVGDFSPLIAGFLLAILTPISIWWLVVLTRKSARSQFH